MLPLLLRNLRSLVLGWRPREGFEKREQVRFFFLCQTKWLHEGAQIWIAPPPLSRNAMTSSKFKKTPSFI